MATVNSDYYLNSTNNVNAKRTIQGKSADQLTMDDFFNLFAAQMSNQDMMNPQENTEFIAQMAQFTSLQGIKQIQEYQLSSYAVSYVGKQVSIAEINDITGDLDTITGTVESITFYDGTPKAVVNGKTYDLFKIMEVNTTASGGANSALSDASKYVGQTVRLIHENTKTGIPDVITGVVDKVTLIDGKPYVVIKDTEYPASEIQSIIDSDYQKLQEAMDEAKSYLGKTVTIAMPDFEGNTTQITGEVTKASVHFGQPYVTVGDEEYPVSYIR